MRAISVFNFDAGTSTFGWRAAMAFRTRVSISAIGSLVTYLVPPSLPARLDDARDFTIERQLPEAQSADSILSQERPGTAAAPAAISVPALELRLLEVFCDLGGCCH